MSYDINTLTDDCYTGTSCLVNKLGITDENKLSERIVEWAEGL